MVDKKTAAEQVEVLAPDLSITIAGREITMREPSWLEAIELEARLAPVIEDLRKMTDGADADADVFLQATLQITLTHTELLLDVIARLAGVTREWMETLSDTEGQTLMLLFWKVNAHFFGRRLGLARRLAAKSAAQDGAKSAQH